MTIGPHPGARASAASQVPKEITVNRTVPAVTPPSAELRFSAAPTDEEFLRTGLFAQPLIPVGKTSPKENRDLAAALLAYDVAGRRDAVDSVVRYIDQHPGSAWGPALLVNLGATYRITGHFSKALDTWQSAWDMTRGLTDEAGKLTGDAALAYLSQFEAYLGRKETLGPLLDEVRGRPVRGTAAQLVSNSSRGLAEMVERPDVSFKCGPSALSRILAHEGKRSPAAQAVLDAAQSTPEGLSLTAVQGIAAKAKMNYQMAFRTPGAPMVAPAVVHWKVGHYAALLGRNTKGLYEVGDPTFGEDIRMREATFDEEASGYALVPSGPLPRGWRRVSSDEGGTVWGRGNTGSNHDDGATGRDEIHAFDCAGHGGCSSWNVEASVVGLSLHDDPVGYTPPVGPAVRFPLDYSQRDSVQPMLGFTYTNFGNRWNNGWVSYIIDNSGCEGFHSVMPLLEVYGVAAEGEVLGDVPPSDCATLYRRGGGTEPFVFATDPTTNTLATSSTFGPFSQSQLQRLTDANGNFRGFRRFLPDGSSELFQLAVPGPAGIGFAYFLSLVLDPQGNQVALTYDSQVRLVAITDALGQVTRLCYSGQLDSTCQGRTAPDALKVTQVTDPFGRSAFFAYDAATGHLTSITDVLNLVSSFDYTPGTDFVQKLTTPYGSTQFAFTDSTVNTTVGSLRSVTATDPMGRVSYVEFHQGGANCTASVNVHASVDSNFIPCSEASVPAGMSTFNQNLQYRNTFIWDPYQYQIAQAQASASSGTSIYSFAKTIHWLHTNETGTTNTNPLTASRIPESIVPNGNDARIWFSYDNQSRAKPGSGGCFEQVLQDGRGYRRDYDRDARTVPPSGLQRIGRSGQGNRNRVSSANSTHRDDL
ncbi:MAG TPA: hypothetical protein VKU41_11235 [Polyangiaceae bacterium]|nr:hypothetical protein [Polyangiaceae bacterium]